MKSKVFKTIWIISLIIEISVFIMISFIYKNTFEIYNNTNYFLLITIEIINIVLGVLLFKKKDNNSIYIIFIVFIIITLFIPIYHNGNTYAPTGANSYLEGIAFKERYLNIYGINIINIFK